MPCACHIDIGLTNDAAGLALSTISGYKLMKSVKMFDARSNSFYEVKDMRLPIYTVLGALQVVAPPSGEVDLELLRDLVLHLRGLFNLKWCTLDSYQSAMMIQSLKKAGIRAGVLSVDTSMAPYVEVKNAIKDERILVPKHAVLVRELIRLERDDKRGKIDHLPGESKDVSDAVAGSLFILQQKEANFGKQARLTRRDRATASGNQRGVRRLRV